MRVLFVGPGAAGHVFPMVPTAQALRAAGHEVLFAGSEPLAMLRNTGLAAVDVSDGRTLGDAFAQLISRQEAGYVSQDRTEDETMRMAALGFAEHGRVTIDALLEVADAWQPDIIVHAAFAAAAPLVAAKLGIPSVVHNFGVMSGLGMVERLAGVLAEEYQARGVAGPATTTVLDVVPETLGGDGTGLRVRYVPFNGGGTLPRELAGRGTRPRVAVTLGTVLTQYDGVRAITELVKAATEVDADFLLAVGDADVTPLGELPANVRPLPWVPLAELLNACDAVVHHGGSGTMLTAAVAGVPQLLLPQGADHFTNTAAAQSLGFALRSADHEVNGELLSRLLTDESLRAGAQRTKDAIQALPSPAELVPAIEALVG